MRRPLALFGAVYLAASLFGILMPQQVLGPAAAFLVCFCAAAVLCRRRVTVCALISASAASALLVLLLTVKFGISPVLEHCGAEVNAEGVEMCIRDRIDTLHDGERLAYQKIAD